MSENVTITVTTTMAIQGLDAARFLLGGAFALVLMVIGGLVVACVPFGWGLFFWHLIQRAFGKKISRGELLRDLGGALSATFVTYLIVAILLGVRK